MADHVFVDDTDTLVTCLFMRVPAALQPFPSGRLALLARLPPIFEALLEARFAPNTGLDIPAPSSITVLPYQTDGPASSNFRVFIPLWEHHAILQPLGQGPHDAHSPCLVDFTGSAPILWRPGGLPSSTLYRLTRPSSEAEHAGPLSSSPFAAPLTEQPSAN